MIRLCVVFVISYKIFYNRFYCDNKERDCDWMARVSVPVNEILVTAIGVSIFEF